MAKGTALQAAKARIITLEAELAGSQAIVAAQRTALAGLKRDAITNASEMTGRLDSFKLVAAEYANELTSVEDELISVKSKLASLSKKHEDYCKMVVQVSAITLGALFLSITMWGVL